MLNVTSKSENETFLITRICEFTETWVVTQRDIKGHIGNQNPQNNMIASFSFASYYCYTSQLKYISWLEENVSHAIGQNSMTP